MSQLSELRKMFPTAKYEPDTACKRCHGQGYIIRESTKYPCICLYIETEFRDLVEDGLRATAKKVLAELEQARKGEGRDET